VAADDGAAVATSREPDVDGVPASLEPVTGDPGAAVADGMPVGEAGSPFVAGGLLASFSPATGGMVSAEGIESGAVVTALLEAEADESSPSLEPVPEDNGAAVTGGALEAPLVGSTSVGCVSTASLEPVAGVIVDAPGAFESASGMLGAELPDSSEPAFVGVLAVFGALVGTGASPVDGGMVNAGGAVTPFAAHVHEEKSHVPELHCASREQHLPSATFLRVESVAVEPGQLTATAAVVPETAGLVSAAGIDAGAAVTPVAASVGAEFSSADGWTSLFLERMARLSTLAKTVRTKRRAKRLIILCLGPRQTSYVAGEGVSRREALS